MKKALLFNLLIFVFFTTSSYAQKKVAVITFYINRAIGINEFGSAAVAASMTKLGEDPNFNMAPLLQKFHDEFFNSYAKELPFQLLPEEQVLTNEAYKAFVPAGGGSFAGISAENFITPYAGYKIILPLAGHSSEDQMLKIFSEANGVMKVYIDFDLVKIGFGGMGVVKVNAHANIVLFNKSGDKVFSVKEDAKSKGSSPLIAGVPVLVPEKILPMCESAFAELMVDLQKDIPKMVKKADARL